ncbi:hypothetical protein PENNAL_c0018G02587 [Penicillium nalgiovense]|uniref:Uncharacterized protein n=1 Tax=Penicillium nalgiovense TaxID=60175 RepID=A0A1V6YL14_PENNA|nr:hypothetical protein PENNAL_c0018G02587 [Penicillium nalgiovense]
MDGSGRYPGNATLEQIKMDLNVGLDQTESIPKTRALAVTTPGAAAGWVDTVERFGSGMLSLEQILAPAIELAEEGFPVSGLSSSFASNRLDTDWRDHEHLRSASPNSKELLKVDPSFKDGVRGPSAGKIMKNLTLAQTFRALAADGKKGFYKGRVVEELLKGHVQVLLNMLAFNYHPQAALDAPRICIAADKVIDGKPVIYVEEGISVEAIEGLNKLGHPIEALTGWKRAPCLVAARSSGVTTMRGPGFIVLAVTQEVSMRQKQGRGKSSPMRKASEYSKMCDADVCGSIRLRETDHVFIL